MPGKALSVLVLVILVPYLLVIVHNASSPERFLEIDSHLYDLLARNLLEGRGFTNETGDPEFLRTPLYPLFIAGAYLLGGGLLSVVLIQVLLVIATGFIVYRTAMLLGFGRRAGLAGMAMYCLAGAVFVQTLLLSSEPLYAFLLAAGFYSLLAYQGSGGLKALGVSGLFLGLAGLARPMALFFVPVIAVLLLAFSVKRRVTLRHIPIFLAIIALVIAPWVARNYSISGMPLISTTSPYNAFLIASPLYCEINGINASACRLEYLGQMSRDLGWEEPITCVRGKGDCLRQDYSERIVQAGEYSLNLIISSPLIFLGYHIPAALATFAPTSVNEFGFIIGGERSYGLTGEIFANLLDQGYVAANMPLVLFKLYETLAAAVIYLLALLGLWHFLKGGKERFFPVLVMLWVAYGVNAPSIIGYDRFTIPLLVLVAVLSGVGLSETPWTGLFRRPESRPEPKPAGRISFVVPFHNEEENAAGMLDCLAGLREKEGWDCEIVAVDDNSSDRTPRIVDEYGERYPFIRPVHRGGRRGMGYALIEGTRNARGDIVIWTMGDLSDSPSTYRDLVRDIRRGYDMVFASRYMKGGSRGNLSLLKAFASIAFTRIASLMYGIRAHDITNAFRAFRREVFESCRPVSGDFAISPEFALKAHVRGYLLSEVPTTYEDRRSGTSNFRFMKMGLRYASLLRGRVRLLRM